MNRDTYDRATRILRDMDHVVGTIAQLKRIEDSNDPISLSLPPVAYWGRHSDYLLEDRKRILELVTNIFLERKAALEQQLLRL